MTNSSPSESLSFPQAIAATKLLMKQINSNELSQAEIEQRISFLLSSKNGGRGFFVAYLTDDSSLADRPSTGVIAGLKSTAELSSDLLVKNLAMSSAMAVAHNRSNDHENYLGSQRVRQRTCNLIQQLNLQSIEEKLQKLRETLESGEGEYQDFLKRCNYDEEQKKAIQNTILESI